MIVDKHKVRQELELRPFGQKGWLKNRSRCPFCGDSEKWGVLFIDEGGIFHCFKGSCDTKTSVFNYLKQIGRNDLIDFEKTISVNHVIRLLDEEENIEEKDLQITKKVLNLPHRTKLINSDLYLDNRGFLKQHYDTFKPCFTESLIERKLHDYIIFQIFQNGELVSWMARSRKSKEWHKENLEKAKKGECQLVLRYMNSDDTDFGHILGGIDNVTDSTEIVILVEGMFDSVGVDNKMNLFDSELMRCCFTFGNKISDIQIDLLRQKKNVKMVVMFYDLGTTQQMKQYSMKLKRYFTTFIAVCKSENDPSDMPISEMNEIFDNLQTPTEFYLNNLIFSI
jgi:hypothetical protein